MRAGAAADPVEDDQPLGLDLTYRRGAYTSPQEEYVTSLENSGGGVTLKDIATRWGKSYDWIKELARGDPIREDGKVTGYVTGTSWRERRADFLDRLRAAAEDAKIQAITKQQRRIESRYTALAEHMLSRLNKEMIRRNNTNAKGKYVDLEVKSDAELMKLIDITNQVHRRNAGMPEKSNDVRGRAEFVQELARKFIAAGRRHIVKPENLRAYAYDVLQIVEEYREESLPG